MRCDFFGLHDLGFAAYSSLLPLQRGYTPFACELKRALCPVLQPLLIGVGGCRLYLIVSGKERLPEIPSKYLPCSINYLENIPPKLDNIPEPVLIGHNGLWSGSGIEISSLGLHSSFTIMITTGAGINNMDSLGFSTSLESRAQDISRSSEE